MSTLFGRKAWNRIREPIRFQSARTASPSSSAGFGFHLRLTQVKAVRVYSWYRSSHRRLWPASAMASMSDLVGGNARQKWGGGGGGERGRMCNRNGTRIKPARNRGQERVVGKKLFFHFCFPPFFKIFPLESKLEGSIMKDNWEILRGWNGIIVHGREDFGEGFPIDFLGIELSK